LKDAMRRFGQEPAGEQEFVINFTFDGQSLSARLGDTIASALYAAGIRSWRRSPQGDERGLLCGIGVCYDCLLSVDGVANLRACQTLLTDGMRVTTNLPTQVNDG
jgi:predicted molibdopterin-dependent oxidoreductase YjgC